MILNVKNETEFKIEFCSGKKEYAIKPGETVAVEVEDQDYMYLDNAMKVDTVE